MSRRADKRGFRELSEEDRLLWRKVTESTHPLHPTKKLPTESVSAPKLKRQTTKNKPQVSAAAQSPLQSAHQPSEPVHAPKMDRRSYDKLRRGKLKPEARTDLHGMTAAQAHSRLNAFILDSHSRGYRLVLVITGKGRSSGTDDFHRTGGVLRQSVPHWLRQPHLAPLVLEVVQAHLRHGGDGAYYVYLRRQRG